MPTTEVITAEEATRADLSAAAQRINETIDLIKGHESAFEDATLEHRLIIGLEITKAQETFGVSSADGGKLGGRPSAETLSRRDKVSPPPPNLIGFSAWLAREIPDLKRPTALKYATAFSSLGLTSDATPALVRKRLGDIRRTASKSSLPAPTLAMLCKQGKPKPKEAIRLEDKDPDPKDLAGEGRVQLHEWITTWDNMVRAGYLEHLTAEDLQPVHEFLTTCRDHIRARIKSSR